MWCSVAICSCVIISIAHTFVLVASGETSHSQIMPGVQPFFSTNSGTRCTFIVPISWINPLKVISICKITFFPSLNSSCEAVKWPWMEFYSFACGDVRIFRSCHPLLPLTCGWSLPAPAPSDFGCEQVDYAQTGESVHPCLKSFKGEEKVF